MAKIYADYDGYIVGSDETTNGAAIAVTTGTATSGSASSATAVQYYYSSGGRGGGATHRVTRAFFKFDVSSIGVTPTAATLKIYGYGSNDATVIALSSSAFTGDGGNALVDDDINNFNKGDVTSIYSTESPPFSTWSTSGYNTISLNQGNALSDIQAQDTYTVVLLEHDHDYSETSPGSSDSIAAGMYFVEQAGENRDPYLEYTSGGYVNDPFGIDMDDTANKVLGVVSEDIDEVMGV